MLSIANALKAYLSNHPFHSGYCDSDTVLDQLYQVYSESHEPDPPEIGSGFAELEAFLEALPLDDNNAVFNLTCRRLDSGNSLILILRGNQNVPSLATRTKAADFLAKTAALSFVLNGFSLYTAYQIFRIALSAT